MNRCNAIIAHRGPRARVVSGHFRDGPWPPPEACTLHQSRGGAGGPPCPRVIRGGPSLRNICSAHRRGVIHSKDTISGDRSLCSPFSGHSSSSLCLVTFSFTEKISHKQISHRKDLLATRSEFEWINMHVCDDVHAIVS